MGAVSAWLNANFVSIIDGFAIGSLLFLMAVGLSLIFGLMDVLNLAHGTMYLLGAYLGYALVTRAGLSFWIALIGAVCVGVVIGGLLWQALRPLAKRGHLDQAILTLGISFIGVEVFSEFFGDTVRAVPPPEVFQGGVSIFGNTYPTYRLFLIGVGFLFGIMVLLLFQKTQLGAIVRASVSDRDMVDALGVNTRKVLMYVFILGTTLAVLGGVLGAPVLSPNPDLNNEVLLLGLIVVVIGGLGSIGGAMIGALVVGQVQTLGVALLPGFASVLLFAAMAIVLVFRPSGLFGGPQASTL